MTPLTSLLPRMLPAAGCLAVLVLLFFHGGCAADSLDDLMLRHRIAVQGPFVLTDGNLVEVEGGRMKILLAEGAADVELKFVLLSEDVALEEVEGEDEQGGSGLVEIMLGERRLAALKVVKGEGRGTFYRVLRSRIGAAGDNGGEKGREEKVTVRLVQGPRSVELTSVLLLLEQRQEEQSICPAGEDEEGEQEVEVHAQGGETGRDRTPAACSALCGDFSTLIREQEEWSRMKLEEEEEAVTSSEISNVTLVVAAINANRPRHYQAGDSSFKGDYMWSLSTVLRLRVPVVVFLDANPEYEEMIRPDLHPLASIRPVQNLSDYFRHADLWDCVYRRCLKAAGRSDGCANPVLYAWQHRVSHIWLSKIFWLDLVARENPFSTSHFLWLDVGRCPHLLAAPLNVSFLREAHARRRFVIFAAYDKITPCFGGLPRTRRLLLRNGSDPSEILRAQLMGGTPAAIARVKAVYELELLRALEAGEVYDKEEPILTAVWDMHPRLFHAIPTYKNALGQNMEIVACWSIRQMSASMPRMGIRSPANGTQIFIEDALLLFDLHNILVMQEERPMWLGGHWHPYATPNNQEVEICFKLVPLSSHLDIDEGAVVEEEETGSHAFGMRVITDAMNIWCLDTLPLRPLPEMHEGWFSVHAYLSKKTSGDPLTESVSTVFQIVLSSPPPALSAPPLDSKWDLLSFPFHRNKHKGDEVDSEGTFSSPSPSPSPSPPSSLSSPSSALLIGCGSGGQFALELAEELTAKGTTVMWCDTCAGPGEEEEKEQREAGSFCPEDCSSSPPPHSRCCRWLLGPKCIVAQGEMEEAVGESLFDLIYVQAGAETVDVYKQAVAYWRERLQEEGVLCGSSYFLRSPLVAALYHAAGAARGSRLMEVKDETDLDWRTGYSTVTSSFSFDQTWFGGLGAAASVMGTKGVVDELVQELGGQVGVSMEEKYRHWYWLPYAEDGQSGAGRAS